MGAAGLGACVRGRPGLPADLAISHAVQAAIPPAPAAALGVLNVAGFAPLVDVVDGIVIALVFAAGWRRESIALLLAALSGALANHLTKALVPRPRPPSGLVHVGHHIANSSFPAGHVLNFTIFGGFLCWLAATRLAPSRARTAVVVCLPILIALMGLARIDAGEHWPTDVLGGYLVGGAVLVLAIAVDLRTRPT